ncbi:Amino-acid acetyltransferase [Paramyrothecium foliicola]|nr:Amino-acid acetyltransferase [Paramyrothecium foliicola]
MTWTSAGKRALSCGQWLSPCRKQCYHQQVHSEHRLNRPVRPRHHRQHDAITAPYGPWSTFAASAEPVRCMSSPSAARIKKLALDRDVLVSVLEVSATRRDAKGYLQTYGGAKPTALAQISSPEKDKMEQTDVQPGQELAHVAIVKLRAPQLLDQEILHGVAKTVSQLRVLGLLSIVVVDCGVDETRNIYQDQAFRLCEAIDSFGRPAAKLLENVFTGSHPRLATTPTPSVVSNGLRVTDVGFLNHCLRHGLIPVIPSLAGKDTLAAPKPVESNQAVLALTRYLIGYQFDEAPLNDPGYSPDTEIPRPKKFASVERVIILDPLGGTPVTGRPGACHRFINLEQEYETLVRQMMGPDGSPISDQDRAPLSAATHAANLSLAKETLSMLPASSSALVTTPFAAANTTSQKLAEVVSSRYGFNGMVTTRKRQNPLLHNLLTDKPVYSSSLPVQRMQTDIDGTSTTANLNSATLVKRGMPLTMFPDPRKNPWKPPKPGSPPLRLTDNCVDLPRLVHLIEDSFNRKLDVEDYLNRVNENLAGIIIAGEYEGGAILTWERPPGLDPETAYQEGRLVPYLDKFAVLKSRQGSGGVADVVFNAMVRDCFPDGVCWRSRNTNPVNKWYAERSMGTNKLPDSPWTLFYTTPGLDIQDPRLADYEAVCNSIQPSWKDNKHILE